MSFSAIVHNEYIITRTYPMASDGYGESFIEMKEALYSMLVDLANLKFMEFS